MPLPEPELDDADSAYVEAFLRARPDWLAAHPELYRVLLPPRRVHGEPLADHMAAMVRAERYHAAEMAARADGVLAAGRAAAGLAQRVQSAVLALIHSSDAADCVTGELPGILAIDAAGLCVEDHLPGMRSVPPGTVSRLLHGRDVAFRVDPEDAALMHGEAARLARQDAVVRVPWQGAPTLLALVTRDERLLDPAQGAGALAFLGRAVGAALERAPTWNQADLRRVRRSE
jgi:uncharacterized protein YigA (DUF484 family)